MTDMNFFKLIQYHLEEREYNNVSDNLMKDKDYLKASKHQKELFDKYKNLDLSSEQRKVMNELIDAIHSQECAYTAVVFRMAVQYGFSIIWELLDMK